MSKRRVKNKNSNKPESTVDFLISPKSTTQSAYLCSIDRNIVTFAGGPAGTGKTYVAVSKACEFLETGKVSQILLTRPLVDSEDDKLGSLPGELDDKFGPYLMPLTELFKQFLGSSKYQAYVRSGKIKGLPLALLRGYTLDDCFIIATEMQNSSPSTMKLILTRLGKYSRLVVDGDIKQKDIRGTSGMEDAQNKLQGLSGIGFISFSRDDIVRSDIVRLILDRYEGGVDYAT